MRRAVARRVALPGRLEALRGRHRQAEEARAEDDEHGPAAHVHAGAVDAGGAAFEEHQGQHLAKQFTARVL